MNLLAMYDMLFPAIKYICKHEMNKHHVRKLTGLFSGIILCAAIALFLDLEPGRPQVTNTLAVAVLMAVWWISECIPLAVTALVPVVLFPVLGIMNGAEVSSAYFNHIIFLFLGGFMMALAMEKWGLHKRIALKILIAVGVSPARLLLGFMMATSFLSMWISNTATTMMMIPIVLSVILKLEESLGQKNPGGYSTGLFLGIAYSSSIGGLATLVGSPTNLICPRILQLLYPAAPEITFSKWFFFALPVSVTMFIAAWILLYLIYRPKKSWTGLSRDTFMLQYAELGKMVREEKTVLFFFLVLALLWIFRSDIDTGFFSIPGWAGIFSDPAWINDGTVAIAVGLLLFIIPAQHKGQRIMDWPTAKKLPWDIVLLFGGGFALALGFETSGLVRWFGEAMNWARSIHPYLLLTILVVAMSLLTELTSNVASTQMLLPAYATLALASGNNPLFLMIPPYTYFLSRIHAAYRNSPQCHHFRDPQGFHPFDDKNRCIAEFPGGDHCCVLYLAHRGRYFRYETRHCSGMGTDEIND